MGKVSELSIDGALHQAATASVGANTAGDFVGLPSATHSLRKARISVHPLPVPLTTSGRDDEQVHLHCSSCSSCSSLS